MKTQLMGILNTTPDSFYDKGRWFDPEQAVQHGLHLYESGADIIDIGGESTRPNAIPVSEEDELARAIPIIKALKQAIPIPLSIDTMKATVAEQAILAGASLINDVSGFRDPQMRAVAREAGVPICVMHMNKDPQTMQQNPVYEEGIIPFLIDWFQKQIRLLIEEGIKKEQIILDPGIGFGKTVADNVEIIHNLSRIKALGFPILLGTSRKSFLTRLLNKPASELLWSTLAVNTLAIEARVDILRVHDVAEHRQVIDLLSQMHTLKTNY